jgi:DNA-binding MarR family transcriptional regulator
MPADALSALFSELADPNRRSLLMALAAGRQTAAALAAQTNLPEPSVMRQLRALAASGWVVAETDGSFRLRPQARRQAGLALKVLSGTTAAPSQDADAVDRVGQQAREWARQWPEIDPDVYQIGRRLLGLSEHVGRALKDAAASQGLLGAELLLLDTLLTAGPPYRLNPTQLQRSLHMTQGGVTKCLHRLEQAGLVRREPDPEDGRGVLVAMLPKGRQVLRNIIKGGHYGTDWVAAMHLSPQRRRTLASLLRELQFFADEESRRRATEGLPES